MGNPKTLTVSTGDGDVVVRKLRVKEYADLLRQIQKFPALVKTISAKEGVDFKTADGVLQVLPDLMVEALPEVCRLVAFPTDKNAEFLEELGLDEFLNVMDCILQTNDYDAIAGAIKKISGRVGNLQVTKPKPAPAAPTS